MQAILPRCSPLLLALCLTGCGQTGLLFLRMPVTAVPPNLYAPSLSTVMTPVLALPDSTSMAPAGASSPAPAAASQALPAPAAGTRFAPRASTRRAQVASLFR